MADASPNFLASQQIVPNAFRNAPFDRENLKSAKTQNALGQQQLSANQFGMDNERMRMVHELGATMGEAALQNPEIVTQLQGELMRLEQPEDKIAMLSDPQRLQAFVEASKAAVGGVYGLPNAMTNTSLPSDVRSSIYFRGLSPDDQELELSRRRATQLLETGAGTERYSPIAGTTTGPVSESATAEAMRQRQTEDARSVSQAQAEVSAGAARSQEQIQNEQAYRSWSEARDYLAQALSGTDTGPIAGVRPAWLMGEEAGAAIQTADGAVAAMAPVLKQLFRASGEGVFTDRDQELLLEMVPDRTDHPAARAAKLQSIDAIVRAKLSIASQPASPAPASNPITATGPNGEKIMLINGQWVPQ